MRLAGQEIRSKATYAKGRIVKTSQLHIFVSFNKTNEDCISLTYDQFLDLCICSDEVKEEIIQRIKI